VSETFTATVSGSGGTPTGSVTFASDGSTIGTGTLNSGVATVTTSTLAAGSHTITTIYGGDNTFAGSTGQLANPQVVNKANSTTSVTSSLNPAATGVSVTFTATVTGANGGMPNGTVTFTDTTTSTPLGTGPLSPGGGGAQATVTASFSTTGPHTITATYGGDANFNGSTGTFTETVNAGKATTTNVTSS
jgi:large repetitive protein